jgi:hypothetical protein
MEATMDIIITASIIPAVSTLTPNIVPRNIGRNPR